MTISLNRIIASLTLCTVIASGAVASDVTEADGVDITIAGLERIINNTPDSPAAPPVQNDMLLPREAGFSFPQEVIGKINIGWDFVAKYSPRYRIVPNNEILDNISSK